MGCSLRREHETVANLKREFTPNQVFVGLPWKNVRPRYERIISKLEGKYPLHFTIVGRNDGQDAGDLLEIIKQRISSSSYAIFDATGGNANVSLEFGYAEGIEVPRAIYLSAHKSAQKSLAGDPIISDLHGQRRVQYKNEATLSKELHRFCRSHPYTARFEKALSDAVKGLTKGKKKRARALAIKTIRALDGKDKMRRAELVQLLQAREYHEWEVEFILKKLHVSGVVKCTVGKYSEAYIA
jgi:hypothetical protein